jgi:uncharacterized RDD family membrane protein YckC
MTEDGPTHLRALLTAYNSTLGRAARVPDIALLRRGRGPVGEVIRLPTLRWGLQYFLIHHMNRSVGHLRSRYQAVAAEEESPNAHDDDLKRLELFQASLPRVPYKRLFLGFAAVATLLGALTAKYVLRSTGSDKAMDKLTGAMTDLNPSHAVDALSSDGGLWAAAILAVLLYCLIFWPMTAYRWKRILFNLYPDGVGSTSDLYITDFTRRSTGVYRDETVTYKSAGARPIREIPWDLGSSGAGLVVVLLAALLMNKARGGPPDSLFPWGHAVLTAGLLFGAIVGGRALELHETWRSRNREQPIVVAGTGTAVTVPAAPRNEFRVADVASLWARARAHAIDSLVVVVLAAFAGELLGEAAHAGSTATGFLVIGLLPLAALVYYTPFVMRRGHRGQSLGKQIAGIRAVTETGNSMRFGNVLIRECVLKWFVVCGFVSVLTLWVPAICTVIWAITNKSNRAPHDLITHTIVVYAKERKPAPTALVAKGATV